ncbi:MAG: VCBS repeat-containing protein, partial [Thermoplasmata archaeon]|nr:VCBS repeat-containing protein [Thermoplasmata archaeon]
MSILVSLILLALQGFSLTMVQAGDNSHPIGNGFISASGGLPVGTSQHAIWFGDIDNDTYLDIATAGYSGIRAWIGDGDGNWTLASTGLPTNSYDGGICMGDINNDGDIDIAAA